MPTRKDDTTGAIRQPSEACETYPDGSLTRTRLIANMVCPRCQGDRLAYNGLLQLTCPNCGLADLGAAT